MLTNIRFPNNPVTSQNRFLPCKHLELTLNSSNDQKNPVDPTLVTWHQPTVERPRGKVLWFTGLSGSGKSTIANAVDAKLHQMGIGSFLLDGDNVRMGLNASYEKLLPNYDESFAKRFGLGFSATDRCENIRRISEVANLFCSAGLIALTAFVSPYLEDRQRAREIITNSGSASDFIEIFVDTPLEICQQRDPKGLYQKAKTGQLKGMTGIDSPYEKPTNPEMTLAGGSAGVEALAGQVIEFLKGNSKPESIG